MVQSPTRRSIWRTTFYALLGLTQLLMAFYTYGKFEEHLEWKRIDALLAEQDQKHPHWRWHEFLPKPLQPGEVNGAMRFIEVGKKITEEMLAEPNVSGTYYNLQPYSKEWVTTSKGPTQLECYRIVRERCQHLEAELPKLAVLQSGCPPFSDPRPSSIAFQRPKYGELMPDHPHFLAMKYCLQWLQNTTLYFAEDGRGDEAILAWRANLAQCFTELPGCVSTDTRWICYLRAFDILYRLLGLCEPGEITLRELQQTIADWRSQLLTADDLAIDRAWIVQYLDEHRNGLVKDNKGTLRHHYATKIDWLPDSWQQWVTENGLGSPSMARIIRLEIETHLRFLDCVETKRQQLASGRPLACLDVLDDKTAYPGLQFQRVFRVLWSNILTYLSRLQYKLLNMEALIAAERFRLKTGDYPKHWNDIVPAYLKAIPQSGDKQFILKPVPEGLVIYLPGDKDHGGKVFRVYNPKTGRLDLETDQGLMIFYPKHRRQPPPPVKSKEKQDEKNNTG